MTITDYVTGLGINYSILFIIILECTLCTYIKKRKGCWETVLCYAWNSLIHPVFTTYLLITSFFFVLDLFSCCSIHCAPKHTKPTANVASKRPCGLIEVKIKVRKDYEGRKSLVAIALQSGIPCATIAMISQNGTKWQELLKYLLHWRQWDLTKVREGPMSDMGRLLMSWMEDHTQQCVPLGTRTVTAKAESLFAELND